MLRRRADNQKAGGLAKTGAFGDQAAFFAITADRVDAMGATPKSRAWIVDDPSDGWARSDPADHHDAGLPRHHGDPRPHLDRRHDELEATTTATDNGFTATLLAELTDTPNPT